MNNKVVVSSCSNNGSTDDDTDDDEIGLARDDQSSTTICGGSSSVPRPTAFQHTLPPTMVSITHARVALCGNIGVGKTTILRRCRDRLMMQESNQKTLSSSESSSGLVESVSFAVVPPDGERDGQDVVFIEMRVATYKFDPRSSIAISAERHDELCTAMFRDANVVVFVFDITRQDSFDTCAAWMSCAQRHAIPGMMRTAMFVGNKRDLIEQHQWQIPEFQALRACQRYRAGYIQLKALTSNDDIDELLKRIAQSALRLQRHQEHIQLVGKRQCPRDCTEGENGRPHRHLFLQGSTEWRIEYLDRGETTVWGPASSVVADDRHRQLERVRQPFPSIQRSWLRIIAPHSSSSADLIKHQRTILTPRQPRLRVNLENEAFSNRIVENFEPNMRVPTNSLTRRNEQFTDQTSLLTTFPFQMTTPTCFMSLCNGIFLGCFHSNTSNET